jgi:tol-pal system beta propeller repeat protein TolB
LRAVLAVAALVGGCRDVTSPGSRSPNLETIASPPYDVGMAAAPAGGSKSKGRIVFVRDGNIHIMNANGFGVTQLTTWGVSFAPVPSPDGTKIAFFRMANGVSDIYLMNVDGSGVTPLTQNAGSNTAPSWSPSGAQIAFASTRDGDADIYVMNVDGSNPVRLTNRPLWDQQPAWSPDCTRIAFMCEEVVSRTPYQDSNEIFVMNADGSGALVITSAPSAFDSQPTWSPDGVRIAFSSDRDGDYDLYVVKADGGRVSTLTRNSVADGYPSWGR